ncbi:MULTISPECIES: anti-sigma regulatory factor [Streptomyces]|uniref:Anti-sigma regulatory factor n=1 Tax=Streptomyces evansiae TaxID=3075535 RepID=A0ABD5DZ79_9ACTN|nr:MULTISPECIES: anti-sigma regulatory factor [unclassified Streptomyces]ASY32290.1 anti-sigma regulatory factor [Streptomyces sp. CLI2509]MDT0414529.1 anti-sigma regulatory factor [Streptomyces sp. DSM 41982]MYX24024.1 anti-sigma regulatory factor [Streptomyces sp. SID8380]SCE15743.1 serine/threonine-protein kinase RsbT [Streptomyces sp. SolWspMP-sol7th]
MKEYPQARERAEVLPVASSADVVTARQAVRAQAQRAGLSLIHQTKLVTAASELGRNMVVYGGGGTVSVATFEEGSRHAVWVEFRDEGPGIPDLGLALTDGWTSGNGMGLGLSGARRLVDEFSLESSSVGTTVRIVKWGR